MSRLDQSEKAIEAYKRVVQINSDDADALYRLGRAYLKLGCWEEARVILEQATKLKSDNPDAHFFLCAAYYNLGRDQEGKDAYKQAFNLSTQLIPMKTPEWIKWLANEVIEKLKSEK